jgi:glycosyltransferase involved in cell wall biosynthesis
LNNPEISVVLPVWNGEQHLQDAIHSILNQSFGNFELLIVDDASTDETPKILNEFSLIDSRIKIIRNYKNMKLPASLNVGFRVAKGDWFTWTSDDNILEEDCLEILLNSAIQNHADFVYSNYKVIDEKNQQIKINTTGPSENLLLENTIGASFLYNRRVRDLIGNYDTNKFMFEDYDYWVRIYKSKLKMMHVEKVSPYKYRIHSNQLSNQRKLPKSFLYFRFELAQSINEKGRKARAHLGVLKLAFRMRQPKLFFTSLFHFLKINPTVSYPVLYKLIVDKKK